jgi:hypothetical protein
MSIRDTESSLMETLRVSNLGSIVFDIIDAGISGVIDSEVVKGLPIVGTLVKTFQGILGLRERIFIKKVAYFYKHPSKIDEEKRKEFLDKLNDNPDERRKVSDAIVLLIDSTENYEKAEIYGAVFKWYVEGKIDKRIFNQVNHLLRQILVDDLKSYIWNVPKNDDDIVYRVDTDLIDRLGIYGFRENENNASNYLAEIMRSEFEELTYKYKDMTID